LGNGSVSVRLVIFCMLLLFLCLFSELLELVVTELLARLVQLKQAVLFELLLHLGHLALTREATLMSSQIHFLQLHLLSFSLRHRLS